MSVVQTTPAFLLKSTELGETDRLLVFYTRNEGKIRGIARGAKKSRKRFGASLDWFHFLKLAYRTGRGDLFYFDQVEMLQQSKTIATNISTYSLASYFLEMVRELTDDHHADTQAFDLLHAALRRLDAHAAVKEAPVSQSLTLARAFELRLLDLLGFRPALRACVECRQPGPESNDGQSIAVRLSVAHGGLVCEVCFQKKRLSGSFQYLSRVAWDWIRVALAEPHALQEESLPNLSTTDNRQLGRFVQDFMLHHTHRRMQSLTVMESVLNPG